MAEEKDKMRRLPKTEKITIEAGKERTLTAKGLSAAMTAKLKWSTSETEHVTVTSKGVIKAKKVGEATITARIPDTDTVFKWKVYVVGANEQTVNTKDIKQNSAGVTDSTKIKYEKIKDYLNNSDGIYKLAKDKNIAIADARLMSRQELLSEVPQMTKEAAYVLAEVGIRNPIDLAHADPDKLHDAIIGLQNVGDIKWQTFDLIPGRHQIGQLVGNAIQYVQNENVQYVEQTEDCNEPEDVYAEEKTDTVVLREGLKLLNDIDSRPPLPRIISGKVVLKTKDPEGGEYTKSNAIGYKVELGGVASPAQDKLEGSEELCCFTDSEGDFAIVMPDRYNIQETITFTVTENVQARTLSSGAVLIGSNATPRTMTFIRRASELINASGMLDRFKRLDALSKENELLEPVLIARAKEEKERAAALKNRAVMEAKLAAAIERRRNALKAIIDELTGFEDSVKTDPPRPDREYTEWNECAINFCERGIELLNNRYERVGIRPVTFYIDDGTDIELEYEGRFDESVPEAMENLEEYIRLEDEFILYFVEEYPNNISLYQQREEAKAAKKELYILMAKYDKYYGHDEIEPEEDEIDILENYLAQNCDNYIAPQSTKKSDAQTYVDNRNKYKDILDELGCSEYGVENALKAYLNEEQEADMGEFVILEEAFGRKDQGTGVLPSVKLMGEGKSAVYLPTDTAPSRVFSYSMIQRLVKPEISKCGIRYTRKKLNEALDVADFREKIYTNPNNTVLATSLGMGYVLNMHQAWVPDGFALGTLLYSLVLAPGEEQRIIVKEHTENYTVDDSASAVDTISDSYANSQQDNETAAFNSAANRFSSAHSDYSYRSTASSHGSAGLNLFFGLSGSSRTSSSNSGSGSSNAYQNDSYDEVSQAAQNFQSDIKTESERIATANRASIRVASSNETESVASKIIANHNHSHVMTVQYWEVMRRYRMETCIEGIDLVLFVPMKPVAFLPVKDMNPSGNKSGDISAISNPWKQYTLEKSTIQKMDVEYFNYRYAALLKHADVLANHLPFKYKTGLNLIKKFAALPLWEFVKTLGGEKNCIRLKLKGNFLEFDNLTATISLVNRSSRISGRIASFEPVKIEPSMNTRKDVKYFIEQIRMGNYVKKEQQYLETSGSSISNYIVTSGDEAKGTVEFEFDLPSNISKDDISYIIVENSDRNFEYRLSQNPAYMEVFEAEAVKNYEQWKYYYSKDDSSSSKDLKEIAHYAKDLPECYTNQNVSFSASELASMGSVSFDATAELYENQCFAKSLVENIHYNMNGRAVSIDITDFIPKMRPEDVEKMEQTLHHIAADTLHYSQVIWSSLSDDERIIMLEKYTVEMDYDFDGVLKGDTTIEEPLINCVNAKKVLGYYGNCMLLPFTYPQRLARKLGKTAADIQEELYRYHTTSFRVPSTVISVATDGMVGEAVLGATNVSEKIDLTRFWNWKDSDSAIDHIQIDQSSLNGNSLLTSSNANTMSINAPTQGVTATQHIGASDLAAALMGRAQPTFADVLGNTDIRDLLKTADTNASNGREAALKANSGMVNTAVQAAADVAAAYLGGSVPKKSKGGDGDDGGSEGGGSEGGGGDGDDEEGDTPEQTKPLGGNQTPGQKPPADNQNPGGQTPDNHTPSDDGGKPGGQTPDNDSPLGDGENPGGQTVPDDEGKPGGQTTPGNGGKPGGQTPSGGGSLEPNDMSELEKFFTQVTDAINNGETPESFYKRVTGSNKKNIEDEIDSVASHYYQSENIDISKMIGSLVTDENL